MEEKLLKIFIMFCIVGSTVADLKDKKIIIIGAGSSGIAAATRLIENGIKNIQILEAENRIGGRIHTIPFGDNVVDMGAHMCHGQKGNVVWDMAKDHDLVEPYSIRLEQLQLTNSNGTKIDLEKSQKLMKLGNELLGMKEMADYEGSIGNFWMEKYNKRIQDKDFHEIETDLLRDFPGIIEHQENSLDASESWFHTSSKASAAYHESEGEQMLYWKDRGYVAVFDLLQKKIPASSPNKIEIIDYILFNKQVRKIDYRAKDGPVRIECADGSVYEADHVICTVSLGVLKANYLSMFDPFLPWEKANSIEGMEFGAIGIVNLEFEHAFWPKGWTGILTRWLSNELREIRSSEETRWIEDIFAIFPIDYQSKSLIVWISGPHVKTMEQFSEDIVARGIMKTLKIFARDLEIPEKPLNTKPTSWTRNPNFLGTYSYYSLKTDGMNATNEALASPIFDANEIPRLQFAGEHTNTYHYASVHGAIETGWREADRLLQTYNNALKN